MATRESSERTRGESGSLRGRGRDRKSTRITFRLPKEKLDEIEEQVEDDIYANRSEALRTAIDSHFDFNLD